MAYVARTKMVVKENKYEEFIELMVNKGVSVTKAKQLVYVPTPMSIIRWSRYLSPNECKEFLVPEDYASFEEETENYNTYENVVDEENDEEDIDEYMVF